LAESQALTGYRARDAKGSVLLFAFFGEQKTGAKRSPAQPARSPKENGLDETVLLHLH
jgi:hypothetical protein